MRFLLATAFFGGACIYSLKNPNSWLYKHVIMPSLMKMDPETAHLLAIYFLKLGVHPQDEFDDPLLHCKVFGMQFKNPIGIAAGFDKNAQVVTALKNIGFGFVEVGTVTPKSQKGNDRPRIFRYPEIQAVINRCGFNNDGIDQVLPRVMRKDESVILGINIGKNKSSPQEVDGDYQIGLEKLGPFANYVVINISSPNTPGLRNLQNKENLTRLLGSVYETRSKFNISKPILVKIAPDLSSVEIKEMVEVFKEFKVDGIIVSNTTLSRPPNDTFESGGLSGKPLFDKSTKVLRQVYELTDGKIPLIGVGGVSSGQDAFDKIQNGASLVQLYTAMTLNGPGVVHNIKKELAQLLRNNNFACLDDAIGCAVNPKRSATLKNESSDK